ncbi:MAG: hypothetical protein PHD74_00410 [Candidatus Krumholzibacteria bacterium]|nr:hypothetical protein [Candidatus Krumholzibacteria bacterium]
MKCTKAQDLYFWSRDDRLDEAGRMELARHLAQCPSCALFVREMDESLDAARSLPHLEVSEGFEWNVKRRILQEKSKLMRGEPGMLAFREKRWMSRFAFGAAAAAAVVAAFALFALQRTGTFEPQVKEIARQTSPSGSASRLPASDDGLAADYSMIGSYTGLRMVSDNIFTAERGAEGVRQSPFQFVAGSREDSLARENELLKRRIGRLERQIMLLNGMLDKERMQRLNMSLP